MKQTQKFSEFI